MRISPVNSFRRNPSFGMIATSAIDLFRSKTEGYRGDSESYSISPKYKLLTSKQLKKINDLVQRAATLQKSFIVGDSYGLSLKTTNAKTSESYRLEKYDFDKSYNTFKKVVERAEEIEKSKQAQLLKKEYTIGDCAYTFVNKKGNCEKYLYADRMFYYPADRFKTKEQNEILKQMYASSYVLVKK